MSNSAERKFCFGNMTRGTKCEDCSNRNDCLDDQVGWGISTLENDLMGTIEIENRAGVPEWVFEWDVLSESELTTLKDEEPEKYKFYMKLNSGIRDESI